MLIAMEVAEFQFVPKEDLERMWKSSRRDRLRVQEDKIWENFCKEQDVVKEICQDNPYEFLENFPETYVKELRETKHLKMKQSQNTIEIGDTNQASENGPKIYFGDDHHASSVCVPQEFSDGDPLSGDEQTIEQEPVCEEILNASNEANIESENSKVVKSEFDHGVTVCLPKDLNNGDNIHQDLSERREMDGQNCSETNPYNMEINSKLTPKDQIVLASNETPILVSSSPLKEKSPENIDCTSSRLKSSIYCSKLKNIRIKMNETLNAIIQSLHSDDVALYSEKLTRIQKCSKEFCNRFSRVYMYPLQQQLQSIKRNNAVKLPFGKHTQFQAQMVKMESLHHNILQALQVFHKSFEQTHCIGDNIDQLRNLVQLLCDTMTECAAITWPTGVTTVRDIHSDTISSNCENLNVALLEHAIKTQRAMNHKDLFTSNRRGKIFKQQLEKSRTKLKMGPSKAALGSGSGADSRLSMYSFDKLRINVTPKTKYMRGDPYRSATSVQMKSSRTTLPQRNLGYKRPNNTPISEQDKQITSQNPRKISSKLPLMKDPQRGRPKKRIQKDKDIKTMVEQVDASPARMSKELKEGHSYRRGSLEHTPTSVTSPKSLDSALTKSTDPDVKKTNTSVGTNENTPSDDHIDNAKSKHPNSHSDNVEIAQDVLKNNKISPPQRKTEVIEESPRASQHRRTPLSGGETTGIKREHVSGARNAQLVVCVSDDGARSTERLLNQASGVDPSESQRLSVYPEKYRMKLEPDENTVSRWTQHRALFLQHMLTSHMYTNSSVHQPWNVVGRISDKIIDDALVKCARELQIQDKVLQMYQAETC